MIGKTISHYKIIEKLGEGGMGIVYKAEDTKLKREVAIKFLPRHIATNTEDRERFKIEAQAAAALNHPNIATIYAIEEHDDEMFFVMEYIDGQELKDKISKDPITIDEATKIAIQIAEGLQAAHSKEIIHRDIKSANIMVTDDGKVKIMDFGLAKVRGSAQLTKDNSTLGTAAYMSPEQASGGELDHRIDIWSLGVVLYEMLTGQLPFKGEYDQAILYSVIHEEPTPIESLREDIPKNIIQVVNMSLAKKPEMRYQNMEAILEQLQMPNILTHDALEPEKSIVVLPFKNMSSDKDNEYFSDGLTDEIITDLSQINNLLVISRSSAMTFKGTKKKIGEIAKEVNVQYVLEGSVRKAGNNLRITAQLIDAITDGHLWAKKYNGTLEDIFNIQEQVSCSIVDALKVKLTTEEDERIAEHPIDDVHAYACYLKARQDILLFTREGLERAHQSMENALKIVGENELIYSGLGYIYFQFVNIGIKPELLNKAEEIANKIFELKPNSHHGYKLLGLINYKRGNFQNSVKYFKKTLEKNSHDIDSLYWLTTVLFIVGKMSDAKTMAKELILVDPLTPINYCPSMWSHLYNNELEVAYIIGKKMYAMDMENFAVKLSFVTALIWNNKYEEALSILKPIAKSGHSDLFTSISIFLYSALHGRKSETLSSVTQEMIQLASNDEHFALSLAEGYMLIDETEKAMDWLEVLVSRSFINYPVLNDYDPLLDNLRNEPRFKQLMIRVKHEWENFEV